MQKRSAGMVKLENIHIKKGGRTILKHVDLVLREGEILGLAGANGSGKSSLIKAIAGFDKPEKGNILLDKHPILTYNHGQLAKRRALLSQETSIPYPVSVFDIVAMGRFPYRADERQTDGHRIVQQILEELDIAHFAERDIKTLSGGERQKVHFARVVAQMTPVNKTGSSHLLLLDEPLKGLDMGQQHFILQKTREKVTQAGWTVLMVLHDLNLMAQYTDEIALLARKGILTKGTANEVITTKHIKTAYNLDVEIYPHPFTGNPVVSPVHS